MATHEQIDALEIDESIFELAEDTELEYLAQFAAPFTGADKCVIPKGTAFASHSSMRGDALYMHFVDGDRDALFARMDTLVIVTMTAEVTPSRKTSNKFGFSLDFS